MRKKDNQIFFIADLHLQAKNAAVNQIFFDFLQKKAPKAEALYILGDLFVLWAGDDDRSAFHEKVKAAFKKLAQKGTLIYLMPGNRDFLLGEKFARESGAQLLEDPTVIDLYGRKTLLMHGDKLCTSEALHTRFRVLTGKKTHQKLFFCLPFWLRKTLAWTIHAISSLRAKLRFSGKDPLLITREEVRQLLKKYQAGQVIHGHIHWPVIEDLSINADNNKGLRRMVLGAWDKEGSVLVYKSDGTCVLKDLH